MFLARTGRAFGQRSKDRRLRFDLRHEPLTGRELVVVCGLAVVLAVVMHWPLVLHLQRDVASDLGDPLLQAWQVAWGGHALLHQPLDYFQSNTFWPLDNSLAFSDSLAGYAPAGLIGSGHAAALARYNLLFLFAYALAFVGAYLLARELGAGRAGSAVGGAAFAYAPFRVAQDSHLHVISSGGIPLCLFLLLRGYRRRSPATVVAGWLVAAWQISLGFTLGLQLGYLLAALAAIAIVVWLRRGRPPLPSNLIAASAVGIATLAAVTIMMVLPYLAVADEFHNARRSEADVRAYSSPPTAFLVAAGRDLAWGRITGSVRAKVKPESELFPGLAVAGLALVGLLRGRYRRRLKQGLATAIVVLGVLSLGYGLAGRASPYRLLHDLAPGWDAIRTPGRLQTLTTLALALLAAEGGRHVAARLGPRWREPGRGYAAVTAALVAAILLEGCAFRPVVNGAIVLAGPSHPTVPPPPSGQVHAPGPQLHLPTGDKYNPAARGWDDITYMFWSTDGFRPVVNGTSGFLPPPLGTLRKQMRRFPDRATVDRLRSLGVRTVVLHPERARGTSWERTASRSVRGLPVVRQKRDGVVVFSLRP